MPIELPWPVVLASASPRRLELLSRIVAVSSVVPADVDEDSLTCSDPWETARRLAAAKGDAVAAKHPDALVVSGDTVVAFESGDSWEQLAKPSDQADACAMLRRLSARDHAVISGVALRWPRGAESFVASSTVRFRSLSDAEIEAYVATGEPMDKAGAYAIQGGAAAFAVVVDGFESTVIGLPVEDLERRLRAL